MTYEVNSLDQYPLGREVEVIYDPRSTRAVVDGRGIGVGEGPAAFVGLFGGLAMAAVVAYQLNSIRRVSRIVRTYPWASERVRTSEQEAAKIGFTRMYVSVNMPNGPGRILLRLAHGLRFRRHTIRKETTLRIAGNPLDDVVIDIPSSRLLIPAGPAAIISTGPRQEGAIRIAVGGYPRRNSKRRNSKRRRR